MESVEITQIQEWTEDEIYLLDKEDRGYIVRDVEAFQKALEDCNGFTDEHRDALKMFSNQEAPAWLAFVKELPEDTIWLINYFIQLYPNKVWGHLQHLAYFKLLRNKITNEVDYHRYYHDEYVDTDEYEEIYSTKSKDQAIQFKGFCNSELYGCQLARNFTNLLRAFSASKSSAANMSDVRVEIERTIQEW